MKKPPPASHIPHPTPHLLIVDNYDSFTYNLVDYLGQLGAELTVWRNDKFRLEDVRELNPDAIVISPGPATPKEAGHSIAVVRRFSGRLPILGVCLGHQVIAAAFGARVVKSGHPMHGKTSPIHHAGGPLYKDVPSPFTATRYHSLVVRDLPDELVPEAHSDDPWGVTLQGLRHKHHPTFGVQFHPESILTGVGLKLLENFLEVVRGVRHA